MSLCATVLEYLCYDPYFSVVPVMYPVKSFPKGCGLPSYLPYFSLSPYIDIRARLNDISCKGDS